MGSNLRGYSADDLIVQVVADRDIYGQGHSIVEDPDYQPPDDDHMPTTDLAVVTIEYPDGYVDRIVLVGPWDDYEDFYDDVEAWEDGDGS